ncbi:HCL455Wp [Eremothecium sinecaudum]|uniref:2-isopropylmalate synthase n=1 Tax=Eremothecium sinecaudum TaxID=45286 RepID=A0A120K1U0_9SACH|nr:HCL455Wp [Eremothecium sinecaudum]AMD19696.1 HCL455Wp [Eremothecium sinecaudum]
MLKRSLNLAENGIKMAIPSVKQSYKNMLVDPSVKYKPANRISLPNRKWPDNVITKAPRWLSTDLRDGNQSLPDPMNLEEKKEYFHKLIEIGFKEIEVAFPSASQTDFDFTRYAVEHAPEDVTIQGLVQSRDHLIERTVEALTGAKRATVHVYLAVSDTFREVVFKMSKEEAIAKAVEATKLVRKLTKDDVNQQGTIWSYEFSPETFSDAPVDFSLEVCEAVKAAWEPTVENPIIFNLPATVEVATPNVYADQIEYFSTHISEREKVCISVHTHNDRGGAVSATELGLLAGADRVEGCLFGNGERTGNVDLITVAMNIYTQGVSPNLDFSDLKSIIQVSERCNKLPIHPRAPYAGELVTCAFSGSHQDAIKKGFAEQRKRRAKGDKTWRIPYLPVDPKDIGRNYEAVIRVNSQSGKGGAAWVILQALELDLPRLLQIEFSSKVQDHADDLGRELQVDEIVELFRDNYSYEKSYNHIVLQNYSVNNLDLEKRSFTAQVEIAGKSVYLQGVGNGPISSSLDALSKFLNIKLEVLNYTEHAMGSGSSAKAASFINLCYSNPAGDDKNSQWGIGVSKDVSEASIRSIFSIINNLVEAGEISLPKNF